MSNENLWQISHKNLFDNWQLTRDVVNMMRTQGITTKQAANDLSIPTERARNWYHRNTGMTALDLLRMMQQYEFVRQAIENSLPLRIH